MKKIIIGLLVCVIAGAAALSVTQYINTPKIAYVDLTKAYGEFELKKELEKKLEGTVTSRNIILDSLKFKLQQISLVLKSNPKADGIESKIEEFNLLKQEYQTKQGSFEESNSVLVQQYEKDIWNQLNKYAESFSEEEGYDIILGANGSGNVMFGKKKFEVTDDFITFANTKYNGNK